VLAAATWSLDGAALRMLTWLAREGGVGWLRLVLIWLVVARGLVG
jgi:hypothetical protein